MRVKAVAEYCIGCGLCEIYCAAHHDGYQGNVIKAFKKGKPLTRSNLIRDLYRSWFNTCSHCQDAPCINGCISGAMQRDERGIVFVDIDRCVNCCTCVMLCPFGHARLGERGIVKCDLCRMESGIPACVSHCPNEALVWEVE